MVVRPVEGALSTAATPAVYDVAGSTNVNVEYPEPLRQPCNASISTVPGPYWRPCRESRVPCSTHAPLSGH